MQKLIATFHKWTGGVELTEEDHEAWKTYWGILAK